MVSIDMKLGANAIIKKGLRHYADHPACPLLRVKTYLFSIIVYFNRFLNLKVVVCSSCFQPGEKNLVWAFSLIIQLQTSRRFVWSSRKHAVRWWHGREGVTCYGGGLKCVLVDVCLNH